VEAPVADAAEQPPTEQAEVGHSNVLFIVARCGGRRVCPTAYSAADSAVAADRATDLALERCNSQMNASLPAGLRD